MEVDNSTSNPVERAKRPRTSTGGGRLDKAQLRAFLEVARGHRLFAFFHLAAYTGARRGELLHRRRLIDGGRITITGSTAVVGGVGWGHHQAAGPGW